MNIKEISDLLEKYYKGETSPEEEILLRDYFSTGQIPPEFESEQEIFNFYSRMEEVPAPSSDFEERILSAIDESDRARSGVVKKRMLYTFLSSAAAILLLMGSYFLIIRKSEPADTYSDPAIAYAETLKLLYNVSESLNNGLNSLEPVRKIESVSDRTIETLSRSTTLIENNLRSLDYFAKAMNIVYSPLELGKNK